MLALMWRLSARLLSDEGVTDVPIPATSADTLVGTVSMQKCATSVDHLASCVRATDPSQSGHVATVCDASDASTVDSRRSVYIAHHQSYCCCGAQRRDLLLCLLLSLLIPCVCRLYISSYLAAYAVSLVALPTVYKLSRASCKACKVQ